MTYRKAGQKSLVLLVTMSVPQESLAPETNTFRYVTHFVVQNEISYTKL